MLFIEVVSIPDKAPPLWIALCTDAGLNTINHQGNASSDVTKQKPEGTLF